MTIDRFLAAAIALCSCLALVSCGGEGARTDVIDVKEDDPEMNAAMEEAREELDEFLERRESDGEEFTGLLKVYFEEPGIDGEHMWVELTEVSEKSAFSGNLLSQPRDLKKLNAGDTVDFGKADISDWLIVEDGKAVGAWTVKLLRSRMSSEEREAHDAGYPFSFD